MSSLHSNAQELLVVDPSSFDMSSLPSHLEVGHESTNSLEHSPVLEVAEPIDIEIVVEELPGAPPGTKDPEPVLEVKEEDRKEDNNDAKKPKKNEKWDWESKGATGFVAWIKERIETVPSHSGYDSAGLERAVSYLERLDNEISKAMRLDLDGELDADKVEKVRSEIDDGIARLQERLDKVKSSQKSKRKKKSDYISESIIKEAQKITGVQGIYVVAPLFISTIARVCINGMVSAGHDIEDIFAEQVKKHKLTDREQMETIQLLEDMGYAMRRNRGYMPSDNIEVSDGNFDWASNYKG